MLKSKENIEQELNRKLSYAPKVYKINKFSRMLYDSCFLVLDKQKTPLTRYLLAKIIGSEKAIELDLYEFNDLVAAMISKLKEGLNTQSFDEIATELALQKTTNQFQELFQKMHPERSTLQMISFRVPDNIISDIKKISDTAGVKLGKTLEVAILHYIVGLSEEVIQMIYKTFEFNEQKDTF
ncbi:hypothetical protein ABD91_01930 [Lysinibacillus sphaericus]|uniref:hypothetical protein n=1 Tax=Lysinibacillus sphaericus TaxID=1421 RepID=UPI0018CF4871|nr:hypothetical protein [Lysinibacillus sphaericus]MBG9689682.1 hypothetical protein [Lysinibacillus sphaericus]